jgi:hypothetical protein
LAPRRRVVIAVVRAKFLRGAVVSLLLAAAGTGALPAAASALLPPGVDSMTGVSAKGRTAKLVTPRLYTKNTHTLLLAFVVAGGASSRERVTRISGDGLRWSPLARSDGGSGAAEVWQARATRWLKGRITATLAAAAYPATIKVIAYGGASTRVAAHAARQGHGSTPKVALRPVAGSLVLTSGLDEGQRRTSLLADSTTRKVLFHAFERRRRAGSWLALVAARTAHEATSYGPGLAHSWHMTAVDVVVPGLKRLIEEGLLTAFGAKHNDASASGLPPGCTPLPAFEVGVQDDPVFLGVQPAMSPAHGFALAESVFHARLLRLNLMWGEWKKYGWAPYDRAIQMAREHCWGVHLTITWTPPFEEGVLNSELSTEHLNLALLASFAKEAAARYAGKVTRFAIGNEPNGAKFIAHAQSEAQAMTDYDSA